MACKEWQVVNLRVGWSACHYVVVAMQYIGSAVSHCVDMMQNLATYKEGICGCFVISAGVSCCIGTLKV